VCGRAVFFVVLHGGSAAMGSLVPLGRGCRASGVYVGKLESGIRGGMTR
jgi:hypothetical protein